MTIKMKEKINKISTWFLVVNFLGLNVIDINKLKFYSTNIRDYYGSNIKG